MMSSNNPFYLACLNDNSVALALLLDKPYSMYWDRGLKCACLGGHRAFADLMIEKGADDWNCGLEGACKGGHRDLVDLMIEKGANDWESGLAGACEHNHRDIVDLMIEKGANNWNDGLEGACKGGHRDIVDLMIENGANDWDLGLWGACEGGHRDLVDLMIKKGANNWNDGLWNACKSGHRDLVDLMIEKGATKLYVDPCISYDKHARLILCLGKQKRSNFIDYLQFEDADFYENYKIREYLTNHHLIRCASSHLLQTKKRILRNVLSQFVCSDVATWSCRFVGVFSPLCFLLN